MQLAAILTEIGTALSATGIRVYTVVPDAADYPAIVVNPPNNITYTTRLNGSCEIAVPVTLYSQASDLASSWALVYKLLSYDTSDTPIPDALLSHTPTNFKAMQVTTANNFRPVGETGIAVDINLTIQS